MKAFRLKNLVLLLMILCAVDASAYSFVVNGIYYIIISDGTAVSVTYKNYSNNTYYSDYCGDVIIPSTVSYCGKIYPVVSINSHAFYQCTGLTSVTIPNTVTSIGEEAFYKCTGLTNVTIPNSVTTIDDGAFMSCKGLLSVTIPNSVTYLGIHVFAYCDKMQSVTLPNSIKFIAKNAFRYCSSLENLIIGNSVSKIGDYAFEGCSSLTSVTIPNSVTSIGYGSFEGCNNLSSVDVGSSVSYIGVRAFAGTSWYDNQPDGLVYAGKVAYGYKGTMSAGTHISLKDGTLGIAVCAFADCNGLSDIAIPNSVTCVGLNAFQGTQWYDKQPEGLVYAGKVAYRYKGTMPTGTTLLLRDETFGISASAFAGCSGLASINIPNSVTSIGNNAFSGCSSLESITIPKSVNDIGDYAFMGCSSLQTINYNAVSCSDFSLSNSRDWYHPFCGLNIANINIGDSVIRIPANFAGYVNNEINTITIPNSVTYIGAKAFRGCSELTDVFCYISDPKNITIGSKIFAHNVESTLYVPQGSITDYKTSEWNNYFGNIVEICTLVESVALDKSDANMFVEESLQLNATVLPEDAFNKTLIWNSSDVAVAVVDSNGLVTAISPGMAKITATTTDGSNLSAFCTITVNSILATSIDLYPTSLTLDIDDTSQLIATINPINATNKTVRWSSGNTSIASVSSTGVVTAVAPGTVYITATTTDGTNLSASCKVTVRERMASSITLNYNSLSLYVYQTAQLLATVYPGDVANKTVTWKSSNPSVATVNNNGLVTAISSGIVTITATTTDGSNLSAYCDVTVSIIPATSITLNKNSLTLDIDDTYQLSATIIPSNATYKTVAWSTSNPSVARVSNNGYVTLVAPGYATITATTTDGTNLSASCQVKVVKRVKSITLNESYLTLTLPETIQLYAVISPSDATNKTLSWTSSNSAVAKVDNNGFVTAVSPGNATISATTTDGSNLSASCYVTVRKQLVTSISLSESNIAMHIGETAQLMAHIEPDNATDKTLTWRTGDSSVAMVDNNGIVTAIGGGTTTVTVYTTDGSYLTASCFIEVIPDYYITLDTLSHIRGVAAQVVDMSVSLVNKNPISGIQYDISLPSGVEFNLVDSMPDVWLDDARATRSHSVSASQLSNGKYRVLVASSSSRELRGNDGALVHMNMLLPQHHDTGNRTIYISNIIASESDETRHTLDNMSTVVHFYYIVGDADANAVVDIADYTATASKILGKSPSPFYYDASNVDANYSLDVVDLVGITNIALQIKPITVRQAPKWDGVENRLFCEKLNLDAGAEKEISMGIDCGFDFAGFQMDLILPQGLTLEDAALGDDASKLGLATETMPDGKTRILGTSFSDAVVDGVCHQLLTLRVKADRSYQFGSQIEFSDILFAERDLTTHAFDGSYIEYVEPTSMHELMDDIRIHVEDGIIIVDTHVAGTVQLIAADGRMVECQAHVGHNEFEVTLSGIYIIHFNGKILKVRF